MAQNPTLSVVIPAYNEEHYLPYYLPTVVASMHRWEQASGERGEIILVDNASTDHTAQIAAELGARVVNEPQHGIGRARNTGAAAARGRQLVFIDADVAFPPEGITDIAYALHTGRCVGGAIPPHYAPTKPATRALFATWRLLRRIRGGAQGVTQFCRRDAFEQLGGYRADLYMSEDVDFFARLTRLGQAAGAPIVQLTHLQVVPSNRRFEAWPSWRMILWTNPVTAQLFRRSRRVWRGWYESTIR